jgi:ATP-dependent helicase HrpB
VQPLPIDARIPEIVAAVRAGNVVLVAEPGAGKTTRVPRALLDAGFAQGGEIVVLEPRRLPTRMAARRVAEELGEAPGGRVGFQVRFEEVASARTRLRFVTEGILARRLVSDPILRDVSVVVLDELHERHLHADVALALLRRLQRTGKRPDLRLVAMSATLDAERVAGFLEGALLRVEGRVFPVAVEHAERADDRPLEQQVSAAVRRLVLRAQAEPALMGDVLVFLPGAAEIRRAGDALAEFANAQGIELVPLHGDLPPDAQDRAVRPGPRRKVILSTNVAESSVTIEGVVAVVDSGLARVASHSPWSGVSRLETRKIAQAAAAQRAGRAGRLQPGVCVRLYTRADHDARPLHEAPEIRRLDLAETALSLHALGERDLGAFPWLEAPLPAALEAADGLLARLGAISEEGAITPLGRQMSRLPVHPRAARLALEAHARGAGARGCLAAALLGERDVRLASRAGLVGDRRGGGGRGAVAQETVDSDLLARVADLEAVEALGASPSRLRAHELDAQPALAALRARDQLARALGAPREPTRALEDDEEALLVATLAAFPDRVARRVAPTSPDVVFADGGAATLDEGCGVREAAFLVACDADAQRGRTRVRLASRVEPDWVLELFPERVRDLAEARFDAKTERVEALVGLAYGAIALDESRRGNVRTPEVARCLAEAALSAGVTRFVDADALAALRGRTAFVAAHLPDFPALDDTALIAVLREACEGRTSFAELRDADLLAALLARLPSADRARLERLAPATVVLPGGRRTAIHYEPGKPPYVASRLQDFFGLGEGPKLLDGRVPLVLHLLAPNQRAVQVTTDLAGFWIRHYPAIRKELMRRYPRHSWPEDPRTAAPPAPRERGGGR